MGCCEEAASRPAFWEGSRASDDPFRFHDCREDALRAISAAGVADMAALLRNAAESGGKKWEVHTPGPEQKYDQTVKSYYERPAATAEHADLRVEANTIAKHLTKLPSILVFRMCVSDDDVSKCKHCAGVLQARRALDPAWHPREVLRPRAANNFHPYLPMLPAGVSHGEGSTVDDAVGAPEHSLTASAVRVPRGAGPKTESGRNPYMAFLQVLGTQAPQHHVDVPTAADSKRLEGLVACTKAGCGYFAKTEAEHRRHLSHHHGVKLPRPAAAPPPPVAAEAPAAAYSLEGVGPVLLKKRPREVGAADGEGVSEEDGSPEHDGEPNGAVQRAKVHRTDLEVVKDVLGEADHAAMQLRRISILRAERQKAWRGAIDGRYVVGSSASDARFPTDPDGKPTSAIQHVFTTCMAEVAARG